MTEVAEDFRERPTGIEGSSAQWGSDAIAAMIRHLGIPYLALNPGASYRGLHDSLVNHLGNTEPQMLLCLHEAAAVHIAQGFAKASDQLMGAVVHSNVGLMNASMAIFNAWCDRAPVLLLGATGPWDANQRRPWIDWLHTASDQGALVRDFTKWDNQPASVPAAYEALLRARQLALTVPRGPTYVNLDASLQEQAAADIPPLPPLSRFQPGRGPSAAPEDLAQAISILNEASRPVVLCGRVTRSEQAWSQRVQLVEALQAVAVTDLKTAAAFPTDHVLHVGAPGYFLSEETRDAIRQADVILSLDWIDLAGTLKQAFGAASPPAKIVHVSADSHLHRGWSMDHQALPPVDVLMLCAPDDVTPLLCAGVTARPRREPSSIRQLDRRDAVDGMSIKAIARALDRAGEGMKICLTKLPLGWNGAYRHFRHPLDYLGTDGGGGVGAGPGITVGAALALRGTDRVPVAIMGDGDFLMGNQALWTACHYRIPCLILVSNNRSFFNDEMHQERVAKHRGRPVENRWIGQRMADPDIDIAMMACSQGAIGIGPVTDLSELQQAVESGLEHVKQGKVCVVDIRVPPGYDADPSGDAKVVRGEKQ